MHPGMPGMPPFWTEVSTYAFLRRNLAFWIGCWRRSSPQHWAEGYIWTAQASWNSPPLVSRCPLPFSTGQQQLLYAKMYTRSSRQSFEQAQWPLPFLLPDHVVKLSHWWFLLLSCCLVLFHQSPEPLAEMMDLLCPWFHGVVGSGGLALIHTDLLCHEGDNDGGHCLQPFIGIPFCCWFDDSGYIFIKLVPQSVLACWPRMCWDTSSVNHHYSWSYEHENANGSIQSQCLFVHCGPL